MSRGFEARLDFGLQYDPEKKAYNPSGPSVGMKTLLTSQKKILPKSAVIIEYYPKVFASQQASGMAMEICFSNSLKGGQLLL